MPRYILEQQAEIVAGVDEAGRGPLAGPVVIAAVILNKNKIPRGINDSKILSPEKREILYNKIYETSVVSVSIINVVEIDRINILGATKLGMRSAVDGLAVKPLLALVDGNQCPGLSVETKLVIGGDATCTSIAAASIIAKVTRDRLMKQLHEEFPEYGWNKNMGYGTAEHVAAIEKYGVCPHHRRSFAPVRIVADRDHLYQRKQFAFL